MTDYMQRTPTDMIDVAGVAKRSWTLFTQKPLEHIVASVIVIVLGGVSVGLLLGALCVGHIRMIDKQERGENIRVEDVFSGFDSFGASLLTLLILVIAAGVGMLILLLPGLFVIAAWSFALWFVALRHASATEALASSWQLLKKHAGSVLVVLLLLAIANTVAGSVVFGILLSAPLSAIFATLAFRDLQENSMLPSTSSVRSSPPSPPVQP